MGDDRGWNRWRSSTIWVTCDAEDRADGENALAPFKASANTTTVLENIIVVYSSYYNSITTTMFVYVNTG